MRFAQQFVIGAMQVIGVVASMVVAHLWIEHLRNNQVAYHQYEEYEYQQNTVIPILTINEIQRQRPQHEHQDKLTPHIFYKNFNAKFNDMCQLDFGCFRDRCWKSCNSMKNGQKQWCHNSPNGLNLFPCKKNKWTLYLLGLHWIMSSIR